MKYDWKFKLGCVLKYKQGRRDFLPEGISRGSFFTHVASWVKSYEDFGIKGLKHNSHSKKWTKEERFELVSKVLSGYSITYIAKNAHIQDGLLWQWIHKYRVYGMEGLECKRGRKPSNTYMPKKKIKLNPAEREELKLLRERNKYLEAENLYLKKLRALELEKTAKLAKAKKQKLLEPSKKNLDVA